jgi:DNA-binding response OmpR family regulator
MEPSARGMLTILLVKDQNPLHDKISSFLMRQGYRIRAASDGATVLDILAAEQIHLLLTLKLPWTDGFEVTQYLGAYKGDRFPYVMAAVIPPTSACQDQEPLAEDAKPYNFADLLTRVQAAEHYLRSSESSHQPALG